MNKLNECFMNHFDKLIVRLCGQFTFNTTLYLRYSLESLKRSSYILVNGNLTISYLEKILKMATIEY